MKSSIIVTSWKDREAPTPPCSPEKICRPSTLKGLESLLETSPEKAEAVMNNASQILRDTMDTFEDVPGVQWEQIPTPFGRDMIVVKSMLEQKAYVFDVVDPACDAYKSGFLVLEFLETTNKLLIDYFVSLN
jgi:hypothetical protein